MNDFFKKLAGFSVGPIGGALLAFITIPLTTHFVAPAEYGKAGMFTLIQTMAVTFLYLGVDQAYTREFHETDDPLRLFQNALLVPLTVSAFLLALLCFRAQDFSRLIFGKPDDLPAVFLLAIMLLFMIVERFLLLSIRMQEKAFAYSFFSIFVKLVILVATLFFVLMIRRDFLAVVYSTALGQICGDLYLIGRYRQYLDFRRFRIDRLLIKRLLLFGLPIVVAASASSFLNASGRLALRTWSSFYEIGIFTATLKISAVLSIIQTSFTNFWVPTAYRWQSEGKEIRYFKKVSDSLLLAMTILFFLVLIFKQLIVFVLSPSYASAIYSLGFLCLQPVMYTVSETTTLGIVFSRKSYLNIWVSLISLLPGMLLCGLLVPQYGAMGAAAATGVSYLFFFWGRSFFSNKNWSGFPLIRHYTVMLLLFAAACINAFPVRFIVLLNLGMLLVTLMVQRGTLKALYTRFHSKRLDQPSAFQ
ncbi:MAG: lipopolysaccharide biosynthesis protein [Sporolactobacillus sp.]